MKVLELFAGYGGASFALTALKIPHEIVGFSEIDKYATQCYKQNHTDHNPNIQELGDITKLDPKTINNHKEIDLITGGYPCQSFSQSGLNKGVLDSRGTLFWEIIRIVKEVKPKYLLLENVKGILSKRHIETFNKMKEDLANEGYDVSHKVLNSKDFGTPQNRQRVWILATRKDINIQHPLPDPTPIPLTIAIKDILEPNPDPKYFLSKEKVEKLIKSGWKHKPVNNTVRASGRGSLDCKHTWDVVRVGNTNPSGRGMNGCVYDANHTAPTITTNKGEGQKIAQPFIAASRGRSTIDQHKRISGHPTEQRLEPNKQGTSNTITSVQKDNYVVNPHNNLPTIRKLTPLECFRLMGFTAPNPQINLDGISNTQQYKMAGNGWELNQTKAILKTLLTKQLLPITIQTHHATTNSN